MLFLKEITKLLFITGSALKIIGEGRLDCERSGKYNLRENSLRTVKRKQLLLIVVVGWLENGL